MIFSKSYGGHLEFMKMMSLMKEGFLSSFVYLKAHYKESLSWLYTNIHTQLKESID